MVLSTQYSLISYDVVKDGLMIYSQPRMIFIITSRNVCRLAKYTTYNPQTPISLNEEIFLKSQQGPYFDLRQIPYLRDDGVSGNEVQYMSLTSCQEKAESETSLETAKKDLGCRIQAVQGLVRWFRRLRVLGFIGSQQSLCRLDAKRVYRVQGVRGFRVYRVQGVQGSGCRVQLGGLGG